MSELNFKKLADVEALDSVPENANAFVEVDGAVKRVPGSNLGGYGGIPTAVIVPNDTGSFFHCENMTYAEVKELLDTRKPVMAIACMVFYEDPSAFTISTIRFSTQEDPLNVILMTFVISTESSRTLKWEENGKIAFYP